ncbi:MAG: M20/M25/M40 family metallo-hydrolase [Pyrinomonadaceae bacterium]
MRKHFLVLTILLSFILPSAAFSQTAKVDVTAAEKKMAETITAQQLSDYLHFVASDAMGGRDTPSQGLDVTAEFLAFNLKRWGFKPAGDNGTFFQKMMLTGGSIDPSKVSFKVGTSSLKYGDDFFLLSGEGNGSGGLVFVKDGWVIKSKNHNDFAGIDVKDKYIVIKGDGFNGRGINPPSGITPDDLKGEKGTDWSDPMTYAKANGAKGVVLLASARIQSAWSQIGGFLGRGRMSVEGLGGTPRGGAQGKELPMILVSNDTGNAIFSGESGTADSAAAFDIKKTISLEAPNSKTRIPTQNVVAIWEGGDPKVKDEMVAVGAHYDHVGTRPDAKGDDKIWNGADDDGSGTVAVLAIAEALAKSKTRPNRSILFVWHAGEEKGLWGSEYFNKYPTVDINKVVAQLNIDMIGRSKKEGDTNEKNKELSGPDEIYVIGSEMMSSTLGAVTKGTNDAYLKLKYNYRYDDPKDPNRFFFRSDHFNYAVNGIPVAFWFDGVHEDYHGAGDHPDKIDYQKMEKITRTIFLTLWEISDLKVRPAIDKQLPPELTRR